MSRLHWMAISASVTAVTLPGTAAAASRGPAATVKAYVTAYEQRHAAAGCALLDVSLKPRDMNCRRDLAGEARYTKIARANVGAAFAQGDRARVVVDLVYAATLSEAPRVVRDRVLLRHRPGGRWRIVATSTLPVGRYPQGDLRDPRPTTRTAALRRLADDELLAISGSGDLLCELLAPGAPLSGRRGGCRRLANSGLAASSGGLAARATRFVAHVTSATRARLDLTVLASHAVRSPKRPGYTLRTRSWTDTLFAVRTAGGWRLLKPSRSAYVGFGVSPPADVDQPVATATWPEAAVPRPSISERAMPAACATPPAVWGLECDTFSGVAFAARPGGGGLVAWTDADFVTFVRPVAAGSSTAAASRYENLPAVASDQDALWVADGVVPVADGALVLETDQATGASAAQPVDADGRPRGAARNLSRGSGDSEDVTAPEAVPAPPGSPATVLVDGAFVSRLGADGRPVAPDITLRQATEDDLLAVKADGGLLRVRTEPPEGVTIAVLGADGRASGVQVLQPTSAARMQVVDRTTTVAVDDSGHLLVAWVEEDGRGSAVVRAWPFDPAAPTATSPVTVSAFPVGSRGDATFELYGAQRAAMAAGALPGGGWGLAWVHVYGPTGSDGLWAARLAPPGTAVAPPTRVAGLPGQSQYGALNGFGVAGNSVVWMESPPRVGLPQVRAAPLP